MGGDRVPKYNVIFKRVEKKYRITEPIYQALMTKIGDRLTPDPYGKSTVWNLYLDTPSFLLIRSSIDAVSYKEKLRLRSYGLPCEGSTVFFEIKKKYKGTVYKRRISTTYEKAVVYLNGGEKPDDSQIMREIDYAVHFYQNPRPAAMICYEREAFYAKDDPALRLTFDRKIRYRFHDLSPENGDGGTPILQDGEVLMEIKTDGGMSLWLSHALDELGAYPSRFSKYGTAYLQNIELKKEINHE
ncbi:MAG: polyphosphate polymerase domain-containing protein [Clostridia bacterium]|nr:polyphosphate polymerase domain-containing protein [Clostridia bacterium]